MGQIPARCKRGEVTIFVIGTKTGRTICANRCSKQEPVVVVIIQTSEVRLQLVLLSVTAGAGRRSGITRIVHGRYTCILCSNVLHPESRTCSIELLIGKPTQYFYLVLLNCQIIGEVMFQQSSQIFQVVLYIGALGGSIGNVRVDGCITL